MTMSPLIGSDSYKQCHWKLYPEGIEEVYSNTTPRKSRVEGSDRVVVFGLQYFFKKYLIRVWNEGFFNKPIDEVLTKYKRIINNHLGPNVVNESNIRYLHSLGYLPVRIKALPEGSLCPIGVPVFTIVNTDTKCAWLTNFLETISQTILWLPMTTATTAMRFRRLFDKYARETGGDLSFTPWQGHDFSMRGMSSFESAQVSGAAHLLSFTGSDTIPAIEFLEEYYGANVEKELISASVTASEHSIQCAYSEEGVDEETAYIQAMLDAQPEGIVSIVCDGYDYWKLITETLPKFKDQILARNGKVVIRPDTGDPVKIVTGYRVKDIDLSSSDFIKYMSKPFSDMYNQDEDAFRCTDGVIINLDGDTISEVEAKGSIQILYEIFGGKKNSKGYIELAPQIGLIYGDSITYDRADKICENLMTKGFVTTCWVAGIGSYTYQFVTRDTYGFACKCTNVVIQGKSKPIFKSPKTGDGMKKSARGYLSVVRVNGELTLRQNCSKEEEEQGELKVVFENGKLVKEFTLDEIRKRLENE
jgi:nicotinamide phosphoribosyltransferase